jgi:hypothetical protein
MPNKIYVVELTSEERNQLKQLTNTGNDRIQILQLNHFGWSGSREMTYVGQINEIAGLTPATLSGPKAVACKSSETKQILYIADTGNGRVVKVEVEKEYPGRSPLHVWALFKASLWAENTDNALTFISEISRDTYEELFQVFEAYIPELVNAMDEHELVFVSQEAGFARYDVLHNEDGGQLLAFPVFFIKDENGNWKVLNF